MSYSFTVRAETKTDTLRKVAEELDRIVDQQPVHAADRQQAFAVAEAFIEIIPDDATMDYSVSVSGYVSWKGTLGSGEDISLTTASINASASLVAKVVSA